MSTLPKCPRCLYFHAGVCADGGMAGSDFPRFYDVPSPGALARTCETCNRVHAEGAPHVWDAFPADLNRAVTRAEFDALRADLKELAWHLQDSYRTLGGYTIFVVRDDFDAVLRRIAEGRDAAKPSTSEHREDMGGVDNSPPGWHTMGGGG